MTYVGLKRPRAVGLLCLPSPGAQPFSPGSVTHICLQNAPAVPSRVYLLSYFSHLRGCFLFSFSVQCSHVAVSMCRNKIEINPQKDGFSWMHIWQRKTLDIKLDCWAVNRGGGTTEGIWKIVIEFFSLILPDTKIFGVLPQWHKDKP